MWACLIYGVTVRFTIPVIVQKNCIHLLIFVAAYFMLKLFTWLNVFVCFIADEKININVDEEKQTTHRGMKLPTSNQHQGHAIFPLYMF